MINLFNKKKSNDCINALLEKLNEPKFEEGKLTERYMLANTMISSECETFEDAMACRALFSKKIYATRNGVEWFTLACSNYFESIKQLEEIEEQEKVMECYLNTYWILYNIDMSALNPLMELLHKNVSSVIRYYYEKNFNLDIYTGSIVDEERERLDAYKEHFYRASFVYNQGKGDLELCVKEWRIFLNSFYHAINERPRIVYDFAREIVTHYRLYIFLVYCIKIERIDRTRNVALHAQDSPLEILLNKVIDAVYAMNEDYGLLLKKYYFA